MRIFLTVEERSRLVKALSDLGVCTIRLTSGEPTVRKYFFDVLKNMKKISAKSINLYQNFEEINSSLDGVIA